MVFRLSRRLLPFPLGFEQHQDFVPIVDLNMFQRLFLLVTIALALAFSAEVCHLKFPLSPISSNVFDDVQIVLAMIFRCVVEFL